MQICSPSSADPPSSMTSRSVTTSAAGAVSRMTNELALLKENAIDCVALLATVMLEISIPWPLKLESTMSKSMPSRAWVDVYRRRTWLLPAEANQVE